MSNFIKTFNQVSKKDVDLVGGKGASLGEMTNAGFPVPEGFVVTSLAFEEYLKETDINVEINAMWKRINIEDIENVEENSEIIRDVILKGKIPRDLQDEIVKAFQKLRAKPVRSASQSEAGGYVAVRSSATAEDSKIDSWAGELESYLNTAQRNLINNVKKCWASLYTPRALFYRVERKLQRKKVSVAVVVQKMVQSEVSGICFTVHPITKDKNQMIIEAGYGLGEAIVGGMITPDSYVVEKGSLTILDVNISEQKKMIKWVKNKNQNIAVPKAKQAQQKLKNSEIIKLSKIARDIEKHYKSPQDIEWAFEKDKLYITQSRPITTL